VLGGSHNPNDSTSQHVLNALKAAVIEYPAPRPKEKFSENHPSKQLRGPLKLELTVLKRPPNAEEFRLLLPLQPQPFFTEFLHPKEHQAPTNSAALVELLARRPTALRWPVVADWEHNECSVGGDGYKELLKKVGKRRQKATKPESKAAPLPPPPPPPPAEWIDYD
jgi:hypothetical protein